MNMSEREEHGAMIITLEGRFDFGVRKDFKQTMDRLQAQGCHHIVLNLEQVSFIDSSALGLLVIAHQNLKLKAARLSLVKPQNYVKQVLDLANVPKMIPVFGDVQQALA